MKVIEVIYTKKEAYTIFEDGTITRKKGNFKPTEPTLKDEFPIPPKPALSNIDMVATNIWGRIVDRKNYAIWRWELDCQIAREKNAYYHKLQKKEFKKKILSVRKRYHQQQAKKNKKICFLERIGNYMFCGERT